jgi:hypothetical protein
MTWITPLLAVTSVLTTLAPLTVTPSLPATIASDAP